MQYQKIATTTVLLICIEKHMISCNVFKIKFYIVNIPLLFESFYDEANQDKIREFWVVTSSNLAWLLGLNLNLFETCLH